MNDISFSKTVNNFIDSLKRHRDMIEVIRISDNETIIRYENYEHEPIKNYNSGLKKYRFSEEHRRNIGLAKKGKKHTPEHNKAISEAKKGVEYSDIHKAKLSAAKTRYYANKKLY